MSEPELSKVIELFTTLGAEVRDRLLGVELKQDETIRHVKETNGQVGRLQHDVIELQKADIAMGLQIQTVKKDEEKMGDRLWKFVEYILFIIIGAVLALVLI